MATPSTSYTDRGRAYLQRRKVRSKVRKDVKKLKGSELLKQLKSARSKTEGLTGTELRNAQIRVNVLERRRDTLKLRKKYGKNFRKKVYGSTKQPHYGRQLTKIAKGGLAADEEEKFDRLMKQRGERADKFEAAVKKVAGSINDKKNNKKKKNKGK